MRANPGPLFDFFRPNDTLNTKNGPFKADTLDKQCAGSYPRSRLALVCAPQIMLVHLISSETHWKFKIEYQPRLWLLFSSDIQTFVQKFYQSWAREISKLSSMRQDPQRFRKKGEVRKQRTFYLPLKALLPRAHLREVAFLFLLSFSIASPRSLAPLLAFRHMRS